MGKSQQNIRRTKSVHELAWSKFNAANETNMAQLQQKEAEVLEDEIRNKILDEIKEEYDDHVYKLESDYDARLENEKKKIEQYYAGKQNELNAELSDVKSNNSKLQKQCASMQNQCNSMQQEIDSLKEKQSECASQINDIAQSKYQLIAATSTEIDALRHKIKMYSKGNWNGIISTTDRMNGY